MLMSSEHTPTCAKSAPKCLKRKKIVQKNKPVRLITYTKTHCIWRVVVICDKGYNKLYVQI